MQGGEGGGAGDDETKFDEFMGSDAGVFAGGQYDEDDREADKIWEEIDNFMDERRRVSVVKKGGKGGMVCLSGFSGQCVYDAVVLCQVCVVCCDWRVECE